MLLDKVIGVWRRKKLSDEESEKNCLRIMFGGGIIYLIYGVLSLLVELHNENKRRVGYVSYVVTGRETWEICAYESLFITFLFICIIHKNIDYRLERTVFSVRHYFDVLVLLVWMIYYDADLSTSFMLL